MLIKMRLYPYELDLGFALDKHAKEPQSVDDGFNEDESHEKIDEIKRKIEAEKKKDFSDSVLIARYQREMVFIRQDIIKHVMKRTKR